MNVLKTLREELHPDGIGRSRNGLITLRNGFFYRHGKTAEMFADRVRACIAEKGLPAEVVGCGEHWAVFKGGAALRNSSHWWVTVREVQRESGGETVA